MQAKVVDAFLADPNQQARVRDVMLDLLPKDWARIVARGDHLSPTDQVEYRRHLRDESIKGDYVKSYGEKLIANMLFENGLNTGTSTMSDGMAAITSPTSPSTTRRRSAASSSSTSEWPATLITTNRATRSGSTGRQSMTSGSWSTGPGDVARADFERRLLADLSRHGRATAASVG